MLTEMTKRYLEPHRFYHAIEHPVSMLRIAQEMHKPLDDVLIWAIWGHDVVYKIPDPEHTNEEHSAGFTEQCMKEALYQELDDQTKTELLTNGFVEEDDEDQD